VIHLDTTFLVDFQREVAKAMPGAATAFLRERPAEPLRISVHALCELEAGVCLARQPDRERRRFEALVTSLDVVYHDVRYVETYGRTFAALEQRGRRIPAMDLLIAVAALVDGASLVTRNRKDFADVPALTVLSY
jgi:tRNA(fMet)-specific endonuclease VapC